VHCSPLPPPFPSVNKDFFFLFPPLSVLAEKKPPTLLSSILSYTKGVFLSILPCMILGRRIFLFPSLSLLKRILDKEGKAGVNAETGDHFLGAFFSLPRP